MKASIMQALKRTTFHIVGEYVPAEEKLLPQIFYLPSVEEGQLIFYLTFNIQRSSCVMIRFIESVSCKITHLPCMQDRECSVPTKLSRYVQSAGKGSPF